MVAFAGALFFAVTALTAVFSVTRVASAFFYPERAPPTQSLTQSINQLTNWILVMVPVLIVQSLTSVYNQIRSNWKLYLTLLVLLALGLGLYTKEPEYQKAADAATTTVALPIWNDYFLPITNFVRIVFDAFICFLNFFFSFSRVLLNELISITLNCDTMDWSSIPPILGEFANVTAAAPANFILSGFTEDYNIGLSLNALADAISEVEPVFTCQCSDFSFIWKAVINKNYGIIQSKHLHQWPDVALNLQIEYPRTLIAAGLDVTKRVAGYCNSPPGNLTVRECQVTRGPNFEPMADKTCLIASHAVDFLDDIVASIFASLEDTPLNLVLPWNSPPRIFTLIAPIICASTDYFYLQLDIVSHLDLFFTLDSNVAPGNYAAEILIERPFSRLYNFTTLVENIGVDLGGAFPEAFFCVLGTTPRILVRIVDLFFQLLRGWFASGFNLDYYQDIATDLDPTVDALVLDGEKLAACAEDLGNSLGHGGKYIVSGLGLLATRTTALINEIVDNSRPAGAILLYFSSDDFQDRIDSIFQAWKIVAGGTGGVVRSWGAFGSVTCLTRDISDDPDELENIELDSMYLNVMCATGTFIEMTQRVFISYVEYIIDILAGILNIIAQSTIPYEVEIGDFVAPFSPNGIFDIGRDNGIIENQCLLIDTTAMFIPSMFNLGTNQVTCPNPSGGYVDERLYDVSRAYLRLALTPFITFSAVLRSISAFVCNAGNCGNTFATWCEAVIEPAWKAGVAPPVQALLATTDLVQCLIPVDTSAVTDVAIVIGKAFIDTNFGSTTVLPCTEILNSNSAGAIVDALCSFVEFISGTIQFLISFFEDGFGAIWNLITEPLSKIFSDIGEFLACISDRFFEFLDRFGDVAAAFADLEIESLTTIIDDVGDYIDGIGDAFEDLFASYEPCVLVIDLEEYDIETPFPTPVFGPVGSVAAQQPGYTLPTDEMVGVCETTGGSCLRRPNRFEEYNGQRCANDGSDAYLGAAILHIGAQCEDIPSYVDSDVEGSCCVPSEQCVFVNFTQCDVLSSGASVRAVWVPYEPCSSLSATCRVQDSPTTTQRGCCITEGDKSLLDPNVRVAYGGLSGQDCFRKNGPTATSRAYYVPGDDTCSYIQSMSIYNDLLTQNDTYLDALYPFDSEMERECCTPEAYIYNTGDAQRSNVACTVKEFPDTLDQVSTNVQSRIGSLTLIAGTGYFNGAAKRGTWWACRPNFKYGANSQENTNWMMGNNFPASTSIVVPSTALSSLGAFWSFDDVFTNPEQVLDWGFGSITIPVDKPTIFPYMSPILGRTYAQRRELLLRDYVAQCRYISFSLVPSGGFSFDYELDFGAWVDCPSGTCDNPNSNFVQDCRFLAKQNATFELDDPFSGTVGKDIGGLSNIPYFDRCQDYVNRSTGLYEILDKLTGIGTTDIGYKMMFTLFFKNSTMAPFHAPKNLSIDSTDARCNNYVIPNYGTPMPPPPPPSTTGGSTTGTTGGTTGTPMAPDEYYEAPVYTESFARRQLLQFDTPSYYLNFNATRPCAYLASLANDTSESPGTRYVLGYHLKQCRFSDYYTHVLDAAIGVDKSNRNNRAFHPLFLYDWTIHYTTWFNVTRGVITAGRYITKYMAEYTKNTSTVALPANSSLNHLWTTNATNWPDFARQHKVTDPVSLRIGGFFASWTRMAVWLYHQKQKLLPGMGIFEAYLGGLKNTLELKHASYEQYLLDRANSTRNTTEVVPLFSDDGWSMISSFFSFNWSYTEDIQFDNLTMMTNSFDDLNDYMYMTSYSVMARRVSANPRLASDMFSIDPLERRLARGGFGGGGTPCSPVDDECFSCAIVKNTLETLIEILLNCIEDLMDTTRFNLDIYQVDLTRDNTFLQPSDTLACETVVPIDRPEDYLLNLTLDILTSISGSDSPTWLAKLFCHLTNTDKEDPHSPLFYASKLISCDPVTDGSAHRGRAGPLGSLEESIFYVTAFIVIFYFVSKFVVPALPVFWISLTIWVVLILWGAYWWSPRCALPLPGPIIPDALFDDFFRILSDLFPQGCIEYKEGIIADDRCYDSGRDFPQCRTNATLNFDVWGTRHMAYFTQKYVPFVRTFLEGAVFPILGNVVNNYTEAFEGIDDLVDTPVGEYCFGLTLGSSFSVVRLLPLFVGLTQLVILGSFAASFAIVFAALVWSIVLLANVLTDVLANGIIIFSQRERNWRLIFKEKPE